MGWKQVSEFQAILRIVDEISLFDNNEIFEVMVDCFVRINCYEYSSLFEVTNRVLSFFLPGLQ